MSTNVKLLDKVTRLVERRQDDIGRLAGRFGLAYSPQHTREFLGGVRNVLTARRLQSYDTFKVIASAAILAEDYDLIDSLLEHLARAEGARSVDADVVAASIRAMTIDSMTGRLQSAVGVGDLATAERWLQAAYHFGLPPYAAVRPLIEAWRARDPQQAARLEAGYRQQAERAGSSFEDRLSAAQAHRELRELILPVYEQLVATGDLARAEQQLERLYACDLADFAPVQALADAYLARNATPGSPEYRRAEALVARFLHDVGEPLGALVALDAVRYQNSRLKS